MTLATPRWWYLRTRVAPVTRLVLTPLSWVWAAATARRIAGGRPVDAGVPVICVGNLTLGGTGKTPVVREIARRLGGTVLSRGYGGFLRGPVQLNATAPLTAKCHGHSVPTASRVDLMQQWPGAQVRMAARGL